MPVFANDVRNKVCSLNIEIHKAVHFVYGSFSAGQLNTDGVYEIAVNKKEWEGSFYLAYAMDNRGKYEIVMRSNVGM